MKVQSPSDRSGGACTRYKAAAQYAKMPTCSQRLNLFFDLATCNQRAGHGFSAMANKVTNVNAHVTDDGGMRLRIYEQVKFTYAS